VTPVKTDLPTGIVGDLVSWSQDHIEEHLLSIYRFHCHIFMAYIQTLPTLFLPCEFLTVFPFFLPILPSPLSSFSSIFWFFSLSLSLSLSLGSIAPDRVICVGLVQQDKQRKALKPIYVHSKVVIVDDEYADIGSANMDNMSFFFSSELSLRLLCPNVAKSLRDCLFREHLGTHYRAQMLTNFRNAFDAFHRVASQNYQCMLHNEPLVGRPVWLVGADRHEALMRYLEPQSRVNRVLSKLGLGSDDILDRVTISIEKRPWAARLLRHAIQSKL
jgi:hypothetical protein